MSKISKTTLLALTLAVPMAQAVLIERTPQGHYNTGVAPQVDYEQLSIARKYPIAPQADDLPVAKVYTYNNNTSEYLRDELGLPRVKADGRLNQYDVTYIPETEQMKGIKKRIAEKAEKERQALQQAEREALSEK